MRINNKITFEKYYAIYKRKDKLGEVKADELIDFCLQLKLTITGDYVPPVPPQLEPIVEEAIVEQPSESAE